MDNTNALHLIDELHKSPSEFYESDKPYRLLQEYFKGFPLDTLSPLLRSDNIDIKKSAVWITSELGTKGSALLSDVLPLMNEQDIFVCYHAIEIVVNCAHGEYLNEVIRIFDFFNHPDERLRRAVMSLVSVLPEARVKEIHNCLVDKETYNVFHEAGLTCLCNYHTVPETEIKRMLDSNDSIERKYGMILAKKLYDQYPNILNYAINSSDYDISTYANNVVIDIKRRVESRERIRIVREQADYYSLQDNQPITVYMNNETWNAITHFDVHEDIENQWSVDIIGKSVSISGEQETSINIGYGNGICQGKYMKAIEVAEKMLSLGFDIDAVCEIVHLSKERLNIIQNRLK